MFIFQPLIFQGVFPVSFRGKLPENSPSKASSASTASWGFGISCAWCRFFFPSGSPSPGKPSIAKPWKPMGFVKDSDMMTSSFHIHWLGKTPKPWQLSGYSHSHKLFIFYEGNFIFKLQGTMFTSPCMGSTKILMFINICTLKLFRIYINLGCLSSLLSKAFLRNPSLFDAKMISDQTLFFCHPRWCKIVWSFWASPEFRFYSVFSVFEFWIPTKSY